MLGPGVRAIGFVLGLELGRLESRVEMESFALGLGSAQSSLG